MFIEPDNDSLLYTQRLPTSGFSKEDELDSGSPSGDSDASCLCYLPAIVIGTAHFGHNLVVVRPAQLTGLQDQTDKQVQGYRTSLNSSLSTALQP
jgi:hypothetical protein